MNGNRIFDFQRMNLLVRRDLRENWRQLLLTVGALFGVLVLIGLLTAVSQSSSFLISDNIDRWNDHLIHIEVTWMLFALFVWGAIVASGAFKPLSTPPTALSMLILPASQTEKFIYRWVVAIPLFFVVFLVFAVIADCIRTGFVISHYNIPAHTADWWMIFTHPKEAGYFYGAQFMTLAIFFAVQSFFFLGSVVWTRLPSVKTFVCLLAIVLLYVWFGRWFYNLLENPDVWYGEPSIFNDEKVGTLCVTGFFMLVAVFNYCLTFMRFRESEIINRW